VEIHTGNQVASDGATRHKRSNQMSRGLVRVLYIEKIEESVCCIICSILAEHIWRSSDGVISNKVQILDSASPATSEDQTVGELNTRSIRAR